MDGVCGVDPIAAIDVEDEDEEDDEEEDEEEEEDSAMEAFRRPPRFSKSNTTFKLKNSGLFRRS